MIDIILHDVRSIYNVGSILRTADGLGIGHVYMTGHTPYPRQSDDTRLPHVIERVERQLQKTALGAERNIYTAHREINPLISQLSGAGRAVVGIEQSHSAIPLKDYRVENEHIVLIFGSETNGLPGGVLKRCDAVVEIPMQGRKQSFNVSVAAAIAVYDLSSRFVS